MAYVESSKRGENYILGNSKKTLDCASLTIAALLWSCLLLLFPLLMVSA